MLNRAETGRTNKTHSVEHRRAPDSSWKGSVIPPSRAGVRLVIRSVNALLVPFGVRLGSALGAGPELANDGI